VPPFGGTLKLFINRGGVLMRKLVAMMLSVLFALSLMAGVQVKDENGKNKLENKDQKKKEEQKKEEQKVQNDEAMVKRLQSIIVPKIDFQKISVATAVKQLNEQAILNDPEKKGVLFTVDTNDQLTGGEATITFSKENVNLETILKVICKQGGYNYVAGAESVKLSRPDTGKKKDKDKTKL